MSTSYIPLTPSADAHLAQLRPRLRRSRSATPRNALPATWLAGWLVRASCEATTTKMGKGSVGTKPRLGMQVGNWCACEALSVVKLVPVRVSCYVS